MLAALACLLLAPSGAVEAAPATAPITIGETHLVTYAVGDQRQVNVYLPEDYAKGGNAAIDASLWWEDGALSKAASGMLAAKKPRGPLFLTYSIEGADTSDAAQRLAGAGGALVCLAPREDLTHATAYHVLSPQALQFLFPTDNKHDPEWGFEVPCSKRS